MNDPAKILRAVRQNVSDSRTSGERTGIHQGTPVPSGHRARVLRAIGRDAVSLSDICRRMPRLKRDPSINRLKIKGLLLDLKGRRLVYRGPDGWAATVDGVRVQAQLDPRP